MNLLSVVLADDLGLYRKLHGSTRPVNMKKSTIKRRKRVMPAAGTSPGQRPAVQEKTEDNTTASTSIISPLKQDMAFHSSARSGSPPGYNPKRTFEPPPVDFTGYKVPSIAPVPAPPTISRQRSRSPSRPDHTQPNSSPPFQTAGGQQIKIPSHLSSRTAEQRRKRSISATDSSHSAETSPQNTSGVGEAPNKRTYSTRPGSISSLLNPTIPISDASNYKHQQQEQSMQIDEAPRRDAELGGSGRPITTYPHDLYSVPPSSASPDLPSPNCRFQTGSSPRNTLPPLVATEPAAVRRRRLHQEAADLREALRRKERELEELG